MSERYGGRERRSEVRQHFEEEQGDVPHSIGLDLQRRVEAVLSGKERQADFSYSSGPFFVRDFGNIISRGGVVTHHSSTDDKCGSAFMFRDKRREPFKPNFSDTELDTDRVIRVRSIPFISAPAKPGDPKEVLERAKRGELPFEYSPLRNMTVAAYYDGHWDEPRVIPIGSIEIDPLAGRYGQEIFGGNQAYRLPGGETVLFRPDRHAKRFWRNACRMKQPPMTTRRLIGIYEDTVRANWDYLPEPGDGRFYIAPGLRATANILGVEPNPAYLFTCLASPAGKIFSKPIDVKVDRKFHRSAKGGTGNVKAAGNYGPVLKITSDVKKMGFDDSLFLDNKNESVRELRASNFFGIKDGVLWTPPLSDEILDGVTRESILEIAKELVEQGILKGVRIGEIPTEELGNFDEAFASGTGVTIAPIGSITDRRDRYEMDLSAGGMGPLTRIIRERFEEIRMGKALGEARYSGWLHEVR